MIFNDQELRVEIRSLERLLKLEAEHNRQLSYNLNSTKKSLAALLKHLGLKETYIRSHTILEKTNESSNI